MPQQDGVGGAGGARGELRPGAGHRLQDRQQARAAPPAPAAVRRPAQTGNTSHITGVLTLFCTLMCTFHIQDSLKTLIINGCLNNVFKTGTSKIVSL